MTAQSEVYHRVHLGVIDLFRSRKDSSIKLSQALQPELFAEIETGRYEYEGESVVCLSTQVGCAMACSFCRSAGPFLYPGDEEPKRIIRNLRASEIVVQALWALESVPPESNSKGIVWSFMGMGEPFSNLDKVELSIKLLGQIYPDSRATISTVGSDINEIYSLADKIARREFPILVKLHISLHGANDQVRRSIVPSASSTDETIKAAQYFSERTQTDVKLNYVLVAGVNDSRNDADDLGRLLRGKAGLTLKISDLNSDNPEDIVSKSSADRFERRVKSYGVRTVRFHSLGFDIKAGCGQLTTESIYL